MYITRAVKLHLEEAQASVTTGSTFSLAPSHPVLLHLLPGWARASDTFSVDLNDDREETKRSSPPFILAWALPALDQI
jgi:hypothetical protein